MCEKYIEQAEQFRRITMKVLTMQLNSITIMDLIAYGGDGIVTKGVDNTVYNVGKLAREGRLAVRMG